ncbi:MAG: methyltransferase domain-containing protein [Hyphomicrobiales bacterium]|nr:methyltransferase domain-containing protein [Hyphomicrobiales bacterium]
MCILGLYERWVLPACLDLVMRQPMLDTYRRAVVPAADGRVLEIGVGSGLNFQLYGKRTQLVCGLDPSPALLTKAQRRAATAPVHVALARGSATQLPFGGGTFDTVVTTWTLCSIADPLTALGEMRRVLKQSGRLVFVEHGLSREPGVARWQRRLTPLWRHLAGGCHLDREVDALVRAAGFKLLDLDTGYAQGPRPITYMYPGVAQPT